jgi:hypothetical protein
VGVFAQETTRARIVCGLLILCIGAWTLLPAAVQSINMARSTQAEVFNKHSSLLVVRTQHGILSFTVVYLILLGISSSSRLSRKSAAHLKIQQRGGAAPTTRTTRGATQYEKSSPSDDGGVLKPRFMTADDLTNILKRFAQIDIQDVKFDEDVIDPTKNEREQAIEDAGKAAKEAQSNANEAKEKNSTKESQNLLRNADDAMKRLTKLKKKINSDLNPSEGDKKKIDDHIKKSTDAIKDAKEALKEKDVAKKKQQEVEAAAKKKKEQEETLSDWLNRAKTAAEGAAKAAEEAAKAAAESAEKSKDTIAACEEVSSESQLKDAKEKLGAAESSLEKARTAAEAANTQNGEAQKVNAEADKLPPTPDFSRQFDDINKFAEQAKESSEAAEKSASDAADAVKKAQDAVNAKQQKLDDAMENLRAEVKIAEDKAAEAQRVYNKLEGLLKEALELLGGNPDLEEVNGIIEKAESVVEEIQEECVTPASNASTEADKHAKIGLDSGGSKADIEALRNRATAAVAAAKAVSTDASVEIAKVKEQLAKLIGENKKAEAARQERERLEQEAKAARDAVEQVKKARLAELEKIALDGKEEACGNADKVQNGLQVEYGGDEYYYKNLARLVSQADDAARKAQNAAEEAASLTKAEGDDAANLTTDDLEVNQRIQGHATKARSCADEAATSLGQTARERLNKLADKAEASLEKVKELCASSSAQDGHIKNKATLRKYADEAWWMKDAGLCGEADENYLRIQSAANEALKLCVQTHQQARARANLEELAKQAESIRDDISKSENLDDARAKLVDAEAKFKALVENADELVQNLNEDDRAEVNRPNGALNRIHTAIQEARDLVDSMQKAESERSEAEEREKAEAEEREKAEAEEKARVAEEEAARAATADAKEEPPKNEDGDKDGDGKDETEDLQDRIDELAEDHDKVRDARDQANKIALKAVEVQDATGPYSEDVNTTSIGISASQSSRMSIGVSILAIGIIFMVLFLRTSSESFTALEPTSFGPPPSMAATAFAKPTLTFVGLSSLVLAVPMILSRF